MASGGGLIDFEADCAGCGDSRRRSAFPRYGLASSSLRLDSLSALCHSPSDTGGSAEQRSVPSAAESSSESSSPRDRRPAPAHVTHT